MGNILQGVKEDDGGSRDLPQVSVVLQSAAGAAESAPKQQPVGPHGGNGGRDDAALDQKYLCSCGGPELKTCKANSATDGGGGTDPPVESLDDEPRHRPSSLPEGVQFVLNTLPVRARCVGDGDGFTAYVEAADVPQGVHVAADSYKTTGGSNNRDILACEFRIRMRGIDAPELKMQYGEESRNELVKLIKGKCIAIYVYGMDQFKRYVGDIYCDGVFIQEQMLKRGFAWHFVTYDKRPEFAQWEREAKAARRGLWSSDNPQKPWEWRRDQRNTKNENEDGIQVQLRSQDNRSSETLPRLTKKDKEAEDLVRESEKKLESAVAENTKLNHQLRDLKNKEAVERAKESQKEMESVVAYNMKLNDQLQGLKTKNKEVQDQARELKNKLENVVADNTKLNHQLQNLNKKNKLAEDRVKESKKEMESVVAENMKLNDQILELNKKNKKALKLAWKSRRKLHSVAAVNMELHDKLQELKKKNKETEDRARQSRNELENVGAENMELNDQVCHLKRVSQEAESRARNWKMKLERVVAEIMELNDQLQELKKENKKAENKARNLKEELENDKKAFNQLVIAMSVLISYLAVLFIGKGET